MLDFFAERLRNAVSTDFGEGIVYKGIVGGFKSPYTKKYVKSFTTAASTENASIQGAAREWKVQPGPTAFMIKSMAKVDYERYKDVIEVLADFLLGIQAPDGGFRRGIVAETFVGDFTDTEPHLDAMNAMQEIFKHTKNPKYKTSADNAYNWALSNVIDLKHNKIYQGASVTGKRNSIHATDGKEIYSPSIEKS